MFYENDLTDECSNDPQSSGDDNNDSDCSNDNNDNNEGSNVGSCDSLSSDDNVTMLSNDNVVCKTPAFAQDV